MLLASEAFPQNLLESNWKTSAVQPAKTSFLISGSNDRNNPLRKKLAEPFEGAELYIFFELRYAAESLDSPNEDEGEFIVLWADAEEGNDQSTHQGVPTFGIHVNQKTGNNAFMARFTSNKEVYAPAEVKGNRSYLVLARVSKCASDSKTFNQVDLWVDPKITQSTRPHATIRGQSQVNSIQWIGFSTGRKTEPDDRIEVSGLTAVSSWEEAFGIPPKSIRTDSTKVGEEPVVNSFQTSASARVRFRKEVYPILKSKCFDCHAGAAPDSGIRLDYHDAMLNRTSPKSSETSHLYQLITSDDPGKKMPPADSELALDETDIQKLKAWIDDGLYWDPALLPAPKPQSDHWSFQSIIRPPIPQVLLGDTNSSQSSEAWIRTPVDAFIFSKQQHSGLKPAPIASDETLLRRISLDLLGLPPHDDLIPGLSKAANRFISNG